MNAGRLIAAVIAAVACVLTAAGGAGAKMSGNSGPFVAFDRAGDIRVMSSQGAAVFDVNVTNTPGVAESAPSWSLPDRLCLTDENTLEFNPALGRTLVYESRPAGAGSDIVLAKLAGNPPVSVTATNLTNTPAVDDGAPAAGLLTDAATQTDVEAIVFARGAVGSRDIWAMKLDGTQQTQLTRAPGDESNPDWSSDGGAVVYQSADSAGRQQLAVIDVVYNSATADRPFADVSAPRLITAGPQPRGDASWYGPAGSSTEDPSRIVHATAAAGTTYLDFIEAAPPTSGALFAPTSVPAPILRQLTGDPGGDLAPSWRAEGDIVAFDGDRGQLGNRDIYRVNADGTGIVRLTQDPAADRSPDWERIGAGCLTPDPYAPRPGTQTRKGRPKPPAPVVLQVSNVQVKKSGTGKRRYVTVRFAVNKAAQATVRLSRGKRTVARKNNVGLASGNAKIRLTVPRKAPGGPHKLRLTVVAGGTTRVVNRSFKIRSLRSGR